MKYYKNPTNQQVFGYDETNPAQQTLITQAIANGWTDITGSWPPAETLAQTQSRLSGVLTSAINEGAQSWGYDDIVSAVSYVTSTVPQYVADANALTKWRDEVWAWAIPALNSVIAGETAGQFLAGMPAQPTKPIVA